MGMDKAMLDFCGTRMIDHVTYKVGAVTDIIVVVARRRHRIGAISCTVIEDDRPFAGPLRALVAGLRASRAANNLVVACDMPLLNPELLRHIAGAAGEDVDAAVPVTAAGPEPLHAAYRDCAVEPLIAAIAAGERSLGGALRRLRVRWIPEMEWSRFDPDGRSFLNVNTPEELLVAADMQTIG